MCPVCGEPLRPDYGEAVESVTTVARVYTVHTGRCADRLCAVLTELGEPTRVVVAKPHHDGWLT